MTILAWIVVGLIAGWLAGKVMNGGGFGLIGDIVVGVIGGCWAAGLPPPSCIWAGCQASTCHLS